jgi:FMN phosphatase YigB (HAD superfamily)
VKEVALVITDLDNTLYDWFDAWHTGFRAMLDALVRISGVPEERLIAEIKTVHERYGTSEYAFLIEELPSLREGHPGQDPVALYSEAIEAYRRGRRSALALYSGVRSTLEKLQTAGVLLVGYTESRSYYTHRRLRKLGLDLLLDYVYSPPDHELPRPRAEIRSLPNEEYALVHAEQRILKEGEQKPNPAVLLDVISQVEGRPETTIYVGDDLVKDISMAKAAGVTAVWAEYGSHKDERYDLLRRVTHWTKEAVERQRAASTNDHEPDVTIYSFNELYDYFGFEPFQPA